MRVRLQRCQGGYVGAIDMATESVPGRVSAIAIGETKVDALAKAALVAERIASDPVIRALIPPQAQQAIATAKTLAAAARRGPNVLRRVFSSMRGPGARGLAKALQAEAAQQEKAVAEVGILPFAALAVKYGPDVAKRAYKALKKRKARKAREARARSAEREAPEEQSEPEQETDNEGGES